MRIVARTLKNSEWDAVAAVVVVGMRLIPMRNWDTVMLPSLLSKHSYAGNVQAGLESVRSKLAGRYKTYIWIELTNSSRAPIFLMNFVEQNDIDDTIALNSCKSFHKCNYRYINLTR